MSPIVDIAAGAAEAVGSAAESAAEGVGEGLAAEALPSAEGVLSFDNSQLETMIAFDESALDGTTSTFNTDVNYTFEASIEPSVEEYISSQDPEVFLGQLSAMNESDLDAAIAEIESGDLDLVQARFEGMTEAAPNETVEFVPPDIDPLRLDYLKSIIELPDPEVEVEEVPLEAPSEAPLEVGVGTAAVLEPQPELGPEPEPEVPPVRESLVPADLGQRKPPAVEEGPMSAVEVQESREVIRREKYGGAVVYDRGEDEPLGDMRILLAFDPYAELWTLPEVPLIDEKKDDEEETKEKIESATDLELHMEEELERKKGRAEHEDGSATDIESVYYLAQSDSTKEVPEEVNVRWFTLQELVDLKVPLYDHVMPLVEKSAVIVEEERARSRV